jgi:hypothetical protein
VTEAFRPSSASASPSHAERWSTSSVSRGHGEDDAHDEPSLQPIEDPYYSPSPPPRAELSKLALTSVLTALFLGPLGSVAAIVFGWAARREIEVVGSRRRGYALATLGLALGVVLTMVWGALISVGAWMWRYGPGGPIASAAEPAGVREASSPPAPPTVTAAPASPEPKPVSVAPKNTTASREGAVTLVDIGVSATSLNEELARQRAQASAAGETMVVMTTRGGCEPCRGVDAALRDPLLQTALTRVRLVRVDVEIFAEDLDALKIPHRRLPGCRRCLFREPDLVLWEAGAELEHIEPPAGGRIVQPKSVTDESPS